MLMISLGAICAPLLVLLMSYIHADASMREPITLLTVVVTGALGAYLAKRVYVTLTLSAGVARYIATLVYLLWVLCGYVIARMGPGL